MGFRVEALRVWVYHGVLIGGDRDHRLVLDTVHQSRLRYLTLGSFRKDAELAEVVAPERQHLESVGVENSGFQL